MNVFILCPDVNTPCGGVRKLYRHADVLNKHGLPAFILHQNQGFRCNWFANQTPVIYQIDKMLGLEDFLVVPEIYGPNINKIAGSIKKIIFNQNVYNTFNGYTYYKDEITTPYTQEDTAAVMVVSEDNEEYLRFAFPGLKIFRIHNGIDPSAFNFNSQKKRQITFMPRKNLQEILQVINILKLRGALKDFELVPIENKSEDEVITILKESAIFLSFGYPEGFSLPPAEALACGCIVIGYHGYGGKEYFKYAYEIPQGDIITFAWTVEEVINKYKKHPEHYNQRIREASEYIHKNYSLEREEQDIVKAWEEIISAK